MNAYTIIEGLEMLDTQRAHLLGMLREYGANDSRTRAQWAYYDGQKAMLELMAGDGVAVVVYEDHHRAIKTNGSGEALPDDEQPLGFGAYPDEDPTADRRENTAPALIFATRRDKYGHREYLTINTENGRHKAIMERDRLAHRSDFVEVGARDLDKLRDILAANGVYIERR